MTYLMGIEMRRPSLIVSTLARDIMVEQNFVNSLAMTHIQLNYVHTLKLINGVLSTYGSFLSNIHRSLALFPHDVCAEISDIDRQHLELFRHALPPF